MRTALTLDGLNFALAGAREGFGPFLGVYLQQQGFDSAVTGVAMGLAGAAGLLATTPLGALIDRITWKRCALALAVAGIAIGALLIVATRSLWLIAAGQLLIGVADAATAPVLAALTLGIVGHRAYGSRIARNEAFNHAGNAANAALSGVLGYAFGLSYVAIAIVVMAVASTGTVFAIGREEIDHKAARGGEADDRSTVRALVDSGPLMILAGTVFAFQAANGAILPFLAQARTAAGSDPSITTGAMTVLAQATMVGAALAAGGFARSHGHRSLMSVALALVVLRGVLAAFATSWWLLVPIQVLEGLAMGLAGVAIPALAAGIMRGTGHASAGLGGVMTAYGAGATLSPIIAGSVAQVLGFPASFVALALVAAAGLALWLVGPRLADVEVASDPTDQPVEDADEAVAPA